ncbi:MAG: type II secretion system GspH family protein [Actinobacteria bacterium]|nr:type II secretion system GspH family protein [Actinomycetota bacterium]
MGYGEQHGSGHQDREAGMTLVEVALVVVIMGVLILIGLPTFLGVHGKASDVSAKSLARQGLSTQKTFYADHGTWGQVSDIQPEEPAVRFEDLGLRGPQVLGAVYVKVDGEVATLASRSSTGTCYWVRQSSSGPATYASAPCADTPADADFHSNW